MKSLFNAIACTATVAISLAAVGPAAAQCMTAGTGAKCVTVVSTKSVRATGARFESAPRSAPAYAVGEALPDGYSILLNTEYYGLPPVEPGWLYYRVGRSVLRVERATGVILADATAEANGAF